METISLSEHLKNLNQEDFKLKRHDFIEGTEPLSPPASSKTSSLPPNQAVTALISQNEDLSARLKISLQKLAESEAQYYNLKRMYEEDLEKHSLMNDQILVWKEKELLWQQRNSQLLNEINNLKNRFPELERMEEKLKRFEKYQEKIKTSVKPYIQQLKDYVANLTEQVRLLQRDVDSRDAFIADLQQKNLKVRDDLGQEIQRLETKLTETINSHDEEKLFLKQELLHLKENLIDKEEKEQKLQRALVRVDELENIVISQRRTKEELIEKASQERAELLQLQSQLQRKSFEAEMKLENLELQVQSLQKENAQGRTEATEMSHQLESLRYLWSQKSEENETLKSRLIALEKMNLELSQKLTELRKTPAQL